MDRPDVDILDTLRLQSEKGASQVRRPREAVWAAAAVSARRRRHRAAAVLSAAVCAILLGGVALVVSDKSPRSPVSVVAGGRQTAQGGPTSKGASQSIINARDAVWYLAGESLQGQNLSATHVEQADDTRSGGPRLTLPIAPPGPSSSIMYSPAVDRAHVQVAYVAGPADSVGRNAGEGEIAVANVDGTAARTLTKGGEDAAPAWSWDGKKIAFIRDFQVWVMNSDGSSPTSLDIEASRVNWSPDGMRLAIGEGNPSRVGIVTIASRHVSWITPDGVEQYEPAWAPDGRRIVYGQSGGGLFISNSDGTSPESITACSLPCTQDLEPSWSSDGTRIVFARNLRGVRQIFSVMAKADGAPTQLTEGPDEHAFPTL